MTKIRRVKYNDTAEVAQSAPSAVEFEEIASGSVELPTNPNKAIFLDDLDNQMKVIDSGGVITELGGGGSGGLGLAFIDHTNVPAELIRNTEYVCDFSGATTDLNLVLPEGTGAETFRIAVTLTKTSDAYVVNLNTTNSQVIALPTSPDTETITGITEATAFAVEFDQTNYNWKDAYFPTVIATEQANVITSAGDLSTTKLTATSWPVEGGVKTKSGWALCDGSTYDETVYPQLDNALGLPVSKVLPNGPFRTVEIDAQFDTTPPGWVNKESRMSAEADASGQWYLNIAINGTADSASFKTFTVTGVTLDQTSTPTNYQSGFMKDQGSNAQNGVLFYLTNTVRCDSTVAGTQVVFSGVRIRLDAKPTWADANLESYPVIATADNKIFSPLENEAIIPKATANNYGTVLKNKFGTIKLVATETATVTDIATNGDASNSGFKFIGLTIGKAYEIVLTAKIQIVGDTTTESMFMDAVHNSLVVSRVLIRHDGLNDATETMASSVGVFVASATTITFNFTENGTGAVVADGTFAATNAIIKELENYNPIDVGNDLS